MDFLASCNTCLVSVRKPSIFILATLLRYNNFTPNFLERFNLPRRSPSLCIILTLFTSSVYFVLINIAKTFNQGQNENITRCHSIRCKHYKMTMCFRYLVLRLSYSITVGNLVENPRSLTAGTHRPWDLFVSGFFDKVRQDALC